MAKTVPPGHRLAPIFEEDPRYDLEAYQFIFDALRYAHDELGWGTPSSQEETGEEERHVTGQELCKAIRLFAWDQFGYMAKCVLNSWGIHTTSDFGNIVYNLIRHEQMKKTESDRREDFDDVFDFDQDLHASFRITLPEPPGSEDPSPGG